MQTQKTSQSPFASQELRRNGDALELPPGSYQVEILSNPPRRLGDVTIVSEEEKSLTAE